jgi:hypothetical protein
VSHRRVLAALIALAPLTGVAPLLAPAPARAADAVFDGIQLELLPVGTLRGDGLTPVDLHVLLLDADGTPIEGAELKASATSGKVSAPELVAPGLVRLRYTPPKVEATKQAELTLKLKTVDKRKLRRDWGLAVQPPVGQKVQVSASPTTLVAAEDTTATLTVELFDGAPAQRDGADLLFRASRGVVENVTPMGGGRYTALYRPAVADSPYPAVITVVDRRDPTRSYGSVVVPVSVPRSLDLKSRPNTEVFIDVAGQQTGPIEADKRGRLTADLTLPPGVSEIQVRSVSDTDEEDATQALELTPAPLVQVMGHYADLPADSRVGIPVRLVVSRPDGTPEPAAALDLQLDHGTLGTPVHEGAGVYSTTLTPPSGNQILEATLTARVGETPEVTQSLRFLPVRPAGLAVSTTPETLGKDDKALEVRARITGDEGQSLPGRTLAVQPIGAKLQGDVTESDDGTYVAALARTGRGPVELLVTARPAASRNSPRQLVVVQTRDRLAPDGLSSATFSVLAVDEYGYPVADVDLSIQAIQGDGQVPAKASTGPDGIAQVSYTAGRTPGLVNLWIGAGPLATNAGLLQLPPGVAEGVALPRSGTSEQQALAEAWSRIVTTHRVEKQ